MKNLLSFVLLLSATFTTLAQPSFPTNVVVTLNQRGQVGLAWDRAASHTNVVFTVLVGVQPGVYNLRVEAGTNTAHTVTNLAPFSYFFAVIARNASGLESDPSNEVSATVAKPQAPANHRTIAVPLTAGIQASSSPDGPWREIKSFGTLWYIAKTDQRFFRPTLVTGTPIQTLEE